MTAITHRKDPIYPTTIVGKPPAEDALLGKATERIFLPLLRMLIPDIVDYALPISGVFHNCAIVTIRKSSPSRPPEVMHAIWLMLDPTFAAASNSPSLPLIHHYLFLGIILRLCNDFGVEKFF